jgi:O-antigen ligase
MLVFVVLLPPKERKRTLQILSAVVIVFGLYLAVFWNVNNRLASVAQQFKSTITKEEGVRGSKDVESTMYREAENYNLGYTFQTSPITGVGFGVPYFQPIRMWGVQGLALGKYIAHNQILWIFVKTGAIGGFIFWFFFNCYVYRATTIFRRLKDPYLKSVCMVCIVQVANQFVVSYVDMQLTYYRNMTYLGILMAIVTVIDALDKTVISETALLSTEHA